VGGFYFIYECVYGLTNDRQVLMYPDAT